MKKEESVKRKGKTYLSESQLRRIIKKCINEKIEDLEDTPEYRSNKYHKYTVHGHTYKPKGRDRIFPEIDYPEEEFDNIDDARKCAKRFKAMPYSIPDNVRIKGHYHTLDDDDWEYLC